MPPRKSVGGPSPSKGPAAAPGGEELSETRARFDLPLETPGEKLALAPVDQKSEGYQPGAPIKFYDEEVKRMHATIDETAEDDRRAARRSLRQPPRPRKGVTLTGFVTRVAILYLAIAYFLVCPNDTSRERAVCRKIDSFSSTLQAYEPTVRPYYRRVQKKVDPYVRRGKKVAQPYLDQARPFYSTVDRTISPRVKRVYQLWLEKVYPKLVSAVKVTRSKTRPFAIKVEREYKKTLAPSVDWYSKSLRKWYTARVEPSLDRGHFIARQYGRTIGETVTPLYTRGLPLVQHHYRTHLVPFSRSTYSTTRDAYFAHAHPRLAMVSSHLESFYHSKVSPSLLRFWSKFIAPQLDKIRERIFEFKAKEAKVAALKRVEKVSDQIASEHGEENFEDFVKELRDDTYVGDTTSPVGVDSEETAPPPSYSTTNPPPPLSPEEQAALTAEKRSALEQLQSTYEREIATLGQTEHRLLVDRLADIRRRATEDIPSRFDKVLEELDEEGDKMVGKLGRYFNKVSGDDKTTLEKKVRDSDKLSEKARLRVEKMKSKVEAELEQYRLDMKLKEEAAVEEATKSVTALVAKAQEELGFGWTWLDDVTHKDWQRYHGLRKAEENLHKSFLNLQSGEIQDSTLSSLDPYALLDHYAAQPETLVSAFDAILSKITIKGQKELKGEWTGISNEAQKAYGVVGDKLANVVGHVQEQASSFAGVEHAPTNIRETMASLASAAQSSASSLASAIPTVKTPHSDSNLRNSAGFIVSEAQYRAAEAYARASQGALGAIGVEPSPTDLSQTAASVARAAQSSASVAFADVVGGAKERASEILGDASQAAVRAVGREPEPTDLRQSVTSLVNAASSAVSSVGGVASSLAKPHSDFPESARQVLQTQGGGRIKASLDSLARSASSALHDATRTKADSPIETASSLVNAAAASIDSLASPHPSFAKSTAAASVKSIVDDATATLASVTAQAKGLASGATDSIKSALHVEL